MKKDTTITGKGEPCELKEADLAFAPWNPRPTITKADVEELAASIREKGLLNRLSVIEMDDGKFVVFAGNRRLAACRLAGVKKIPCEVFDISTKEAMVLTALENLQRKDVDPMREANLVGECLSCGMSGEEIAAKVGKSNAWVCRRRKLLDLTDDYKKAALDNPENITADALENISRYPADIQSALAKRVLKSVGTRRVTWSDVSFDFERMTASLDSARFIKHPVCGSEEKCRSCTKRTGALADLFDNVQEGSLGSCLDKKCFGEQDDAWEGNALADALSGCPKSTEVVRVQYAWEVPREATGERRTKKNPCAYVHIDKYSGDVTIHWGPSKKEIDERKAKDDEQRAAERAQHAEIDKIVRSVQDKIDDISEFKILDVIDDAVGAGLAKPLRVILAKALYYWLNDRFYDYDREQMVFAIENIKPLRELLGVEDGAIDAIRPDGYDEAKAAKLDGEEGVRVESEGDIGDESEE